MTATPFYNSISQGRSGGDLTELQVEALLRETLEEIEEKQHVVFSDLKLPGDVKDEIKTELADSEYFSSGLGHAPHIRGPEMSWTVEEKNILDRVLIEQITASKTCCPVR